jgi:hypothetical protein
MQHSRSLEVNSALVRPDIARILLEPASLLPYVQKPATGPYNGPNEPIL